MLVLYVHPGAQRGALLCITWTLSTSIFPAVAQIVWQMAKVLTTSLAESADR